MWKNYLKMCIQFLFMDNKEFLLVCDNCGIIHDINDFKYEIIKSEEV